MTSRCTTLFTGISDVTVYKSMIINRKYKYLIKFHRFTYSIIWGNSLTHAPNEKTWKYDLVKCAAIYAAVPNLYVLNAKEEK